MKKKIGKIVFAIVILAFSAYSGLSYNMAFYGKC